MKIYLDSVSGFHIAEHKGRQCLGYSHYEAANRLLSVLSRDGVVIKRRPLRVFRWAGLFKNLFHVRQNSTIA